MPKLFRPQLRVPFSFVAATLAATLSVATTPIVAHAAPGDDDAEQSPKVRADALSDEAVTKFAAEEFDAAVDLFEQAYALDEQANYLFNIGRVYEEKGDLPKAVEYYQRFVASKGVDLEARQNATERLEVLRKAVKALEDDEPDPTPEPATDPVAEDSDPDTDAGDDSTDDGADDRKRKLRIAGYSLLGVGGAALIVGGIFGGLALGTSNDADEERFVDDALSGRDRAKTQAAVADAMFITGGVLAATGLVLVLSTLRGKKQSDTARHERGGVRTVARNAQWSAWGGTRGAGLSLSGRF